MLRSGRHMTSLTDKNIEKFQEIEIGNGHSSLGKIAPSLNISHQYVRSILVDISGMRHIATRLPPRELNFLQKPNEICIYEFDIQTGQEASESKGKVMLIVFFDICGLVHHELVPKERTVNKEYYLPVLKPVRNGKICGRKFCGFYMTIIRHRIERQL